MRLRSFIGSVSLLAFAISAVTIVALKGGTRMSMKHDEAEARAALPSADTRLSGTFETATFALG